MKDPRSYKNIVFGMGHVLCEYSPRRSIERQTSDEAVIREICTIVFCSYEWCLYDMGLMDEQQVAQYTLPRLSSDAVRLIAAEALRTWHLYNLWPKQGIERVVRDLNVRGQRRKRHGRLAVQIRQCQRTARRPRPARRCQPDKARQKRARLPLKTMNS